MNDRIPRRTQGRYGELRSAADPGNLPLPGRRGKAHIAHGSVPDPNPALQGKRQRVAINVKTDVVETEYQAGRISEAAYLAARAYGAVLERAAGAPSGGGQWQEGDRVDAAAAHEVAIRRSLDRTRQAIVIKGEVRAVVGAVGERVLASVLIDRRTLADIAAEISGHANKRAAGHVAWLFRRCCEELADHWAATALPGT